MESLLLKKKKAAARIDEKKDETIILEDIAERSDKLADGISYYGYNGIIKIIREAYPSDSLV